MTTNQVIWIGVGYGILLMGFLADPFNPWIFCPLFAAAVLMQIDVILMRRNR